MTYNVFDGTLNLTHLQLLSSRNRAFLVSCHPRAVCL